MSTVASPLPTPSLSASLSPSPQDAVQAEMAAVDAVIRHHLHSDIALIQQVAEYIIASGGKRLRPVLLLLSARALGASGPRCHTLAAAIELIHTATLLHDDVVDESSLRRGRQTANARFGNAASVLVGDFLYSRAFQMMVQAGDMRVMAAMADATNVIAEGEVLQLMQIGNADLTQDDYLRIVRYKTAQLFEAAARIGALIAGAAEPEIAALARYGMHLGTAFQIVDDLLDYSGTQQQIGKQLGDDLAEGKCTLPLILARQRGDAAQRAVIQQVVEGAQRDQLESVLAILAATDALESTRTIAREETALARATLAALPPSTTRDALDILAHDAVERVV